METCLCSLNIYSRETVELILETCNIPHVQWYQCQTSHLSLFFFYHRNLFIWMGIYQTLDMFWVILSRDVQRSGAHGRSITNPIASSCCYTHHIKVVHTLSVCFLWRLMSILLSLLVFNSSSFHFSVNPKTTRSFGVQTLSVSLSVCIHPSVRPSIRPFLEVLMCPMQYNSSPPLCVHVSFRGSTLAAVL